MSKVANKNVRHCLFCSNELLHKDRKYCSPDCWYRRNTNQKKICEGCGIAFYAKRREGIAHFKLRRFCSLPCVTEWRERQVKAGIIKQANRNKFASGESNPNWNGGTTPINEKLRKTSRYKRWRQTVFKRDNYTCQFCGKRGGDINADHIKPFAFFPNLRYELSNGRTLCIPCHRTTFFGNKYV